MITSRKQRPTRNYPNCCLYVYTYTYWILFFHSLRNCFFSVRLNVDVYYNTSAIMFIRWLGNCLICFSTTFPYSLRFIWTRQNTNSKQQSLFDQLAQTPNIFPLTTKKPVDWTRFFVSPSTASIRQNKFSYDMKQFYRVMFSGCAFSSFAVFLTLSISVWPNKFGQSSIAIVVVGSVWTVTRLPQKIALFLVLLIFEWIIRLP